MLYMHEMNISKTNIKSASKYVEADKFKDLEKMADSLRYEVLKMIRNSGTGHPGGCLSVLDLLFYLYRHAMNVDPNDPDKSDRDRLILSKGHASAALYAVLADKGFFGKEMFSEFGRIDGRLQGHPDMRKTPGVDFSTGSLGQGLSVGIGVALGARFRKYGSYVYVIVGDGELQEGQMWEAVGYAARCRLSNLILIVDCNGLQLSSTVCDTANISVRMPWLGWEVLHINGHDYHDIERAVQKAKNNKSKPTCIFAKTVKGKGVPFMENVVEWHSKEITAVDMEKIGTLFKHGG